jgi:hypothetical protein
MPNNVTCRCGKSYVAHSTLAGKTLKCPACGAFLRFPAAPARSVAECAADFLETHGNNGGWKDLTALEKSGTPVARRRLIPRPVAERDPPKPSDPRRRRWIGRGVIGVLAVLVLVGVGVVVYRNQDILSNLSWDACLSKSGGFSVSLPSGWTGRRIRETRSPHPSLKSTFEGVSFADGTQVGVVYMNLRTSGEEAKDTLPEGALRFLEREYYGDVSMAWEFDLRLGSHPGKELGYEHAQASRRRISYSRWFLVGDRLYDVTWITGSGGEPPADTLLEFWNSFRLLEEPHAVVTIVDTPTATVASNAAVADQPNQVGVRPRTSLESGLGERQSWPMGTAN